MTSSTRAVIGWQQSPRATSGYKKTATAGLAVTCRVTAGPDASEETAYLAAGLQRNFPLP